jgi:outer membrane PBP1 activator LpoA protein
MIHGASRQYWMAILTAALGTAAVTALLYGALSPLTSARAQGGSPLGVDVPHIALMLPVDSSTFRRHGEALRDGFIAASRVPDPPTMLIRVYPIGEDPKTAAAAYQQAVHTGARVVVGPLLRAPAAAVAGGDIRVPTLLLNLPDGNTPARPNLYVLSVQIEAEARQAARAAWRDGRKGALTIAGDSPLLKRVHQAFVDEFRALGGKVAAEFLFNTSPAELERLRKTVEGKSADMAFLALDARQARGVRGTLEPLPLYASSQAYTGDISPGTVVDLAGIRVFDMPWLLQRDHAAVMIYPRQNFGDPDLERLYALGIDAWRISQALLARHTELNIDGVTGKLTLDRNRHFTRELAMLRLGENLPASPVGQLPPTPAAAPEKPPPTKPVPKPAPKNTPAKSPPPKP